MINNPDQKFSELRRLITSLRTEQSIMCDTHTENTVQALEDIQYCTFQRKLISFLKSTEYKVLYI